MNAGKVHYFVAGGLGSGGGPGGGSGGGTTTAGKISAWVEANYAPQTVGGQTVHDLTASTSPAS